MAIPRKLPIETQVVFPHGAYMVGDIEPLRDYDKSTKDQLVQAADPETGVLLWAVDVVDADPDASKATRTMTVKVQAPVKPVLSRSSDGPFTEVEFTEMTATPYVEEVGTFKRIAWSLRAKGVGNATSKPASRSEKAVA